MRLYECVYSLPGVCFHALNGFQDDDRKAVIHRKKWQQLSNKVFVFVFHSGCIVLLKMCKFR